MMDKAKRHLINFIKNKGYYDQYINIGPIKQKIYRKLQLGNLNWVWLEVMI